MFFLHFSDEVLKTEFTFFPFAPIEQPTHDGALSVDSLMDIAVNKLFTIYQKPRSRDFIDLYLILQQQQWAIEELKQKAQIKFETYIDPLLLGSRYMQATVLKEYPRMLTPCNHAQWQQFFVQQAQLLGSTVLK